MNEPKIYSFDSSLLPDANPKDGFCVDLVRVGDYAALKAERDALADRVNALAVESAALKSGCGFFAYDPDNGFEQFKTKDEAIAAAESYIDYYRGEACDGWPDEVAQVSWGIIMQESTRVNERPRDKDDSCDPAIETVCDYALLPNIETPATDAALAAIQAQGVEKLIKLKMEQLASMHPDTHAFGATAESLRAQINELQAFAAELREAK
ncbi:hypothetical protein SM14VA4_04710 [Serratia marcescens]|nr:hypothetical protein SM14VA4_04710 [Serratia marcescens]